MLRRRSRLQLGLALLLLCQSALCSTASERGEEEEEGELQHALHPHEPETTPEFYFWNEITGEVQWEDPGDVPFEDEGGMRYWYNKEGKELDRDPRAHQYTWVESWSEEHERPFFYNQETTESTWERPPDLAWRRVQSEPFHDEL